MKTNNVYVFDNYEVANRLLARGYKLIYMRPNWKQDNSMVYIFEPAAKEALDEVLVELGLKSQLDDSIKA